MLPKGDRLRKEKEIRETLKHPGRKFKTPLLYFITRPNDLNGPRLLVITKKSLGGAVKRNRIKRLVKAAYLKIRRKININIDIVVFPNKEAESSSLQYLAQLLEKSLVSA